MSKYRVTANELRFRSSPNSQTNRNIVAVLSNGQLVEKIADADWWEVRTLLSGVPDVTGYVAHRFLEAIPSQAPPTPITTSTPAPILANIVPPVHLQENRANVTRKVTTGRAYPLGEPNRPSRDPNSVATACATIHNIISWLDVEQSARYAPTSSSTYCNIYAHDYCYLNGVFSAPGMVDKPGAY